MKSLHKGISYINFGTLVVESNRFWEIEWISSNIELCFAIFLFHVNNWGIEINMFRHHLVFSKVISSWKIVCRNPFAHKHLIFTSHCKSVECSEKVFLEFRIFRFLVFFQTTHVVWPSKRNSIAFSIKLNIETFDSLTALWPSMVNNKELFFVFADPIRSESHSMRIEINIIWEPWVLQHVN